MKAAGAPSIEAWTKEVSAKFVEGKDLLKQRDTLIAKYAGK
jgi:hypothetical protein